MIPSSSGDSYTIKEWKAGHYVPTKKRWVYGVLILTPNFLLFQDDDKKEPIDDVIVYFAEFTEVKRENSSYMFRCVTVNTNTGKHWFGSLPNREEVFHYVEHFWKERLVGKPAPTISLGENGEQTELGRELLRLAYDSQNTLNTAGERLANQGDQLDYASQVVDDINNDLTIAEHLIEGLDSWLGKWSAVARVPDSPVTEDSNKPKTYPLLYAKKFNDYAYPATLEIQEDKLEFKDLKGKKVQSFSFKDISTMVISTPWNVKISQYMIGKPDINFFITSSKMVQILKALEPICGQKFEYDEANLPENTVDLDSQPMKSYGDLDTGHEHYGGSPRVRAGHQQSHAQKTSQIVSDSEADELKQVVGNLKSMALDIQKEQDLQSEKITHLTGKVEDTTERVKSDSKHMKRLL
ncbi:synaptosomal-associated protein 47-like [Ptychodera flava]|uniref:synaptosomal-associated protein 47-like n=1 Tax=Ptychodera flava TaxID=63121 RepID=UPI00396A9DBD